MTELLTSEGLLALAIAVLELVLGWRFTLPERSRDLLGFGGYAAAVAIGFLAGRGHVAASPPWPAPLALRLAGTALLLGGLFLAGASSKARLLAGRGRPATTGPYARIRHPLHLGLTLVLIGGCLRAPSALGAALVIVGGTVYGILALAEGRANRPV